MDFVFHLNLFSFCLNMFALQYLILYCHKVSNFPLAFLLSYHMNAPTWTTNELPGAHMSCVIKILILLGHSPTKAKDPPCQTLIQSLSRVLSCPGMGGCKASFIWQCQNRYICFHFDSTYNQHVQYCLQIAGIMKPNSNFKTTYYHISNFPTNKRTMAHKSHHI